MKYRAPRVPAEPGGEGWITDLDGKRLMRIETVSRDRSLGVILLSDRGELRAAARLQRTLTGTVAKVEVAGCAFATLGLRGRKRAGAVRVRAAPGDYDIAGDFAAWDFHVLLDASPVADVASRKTDATAYLIETSDTEAQVPLLALILATDLLVQTFP
jgi:hypothetical protein